jgi:heterodisulfide reductase subunit A
MSKDNSKVGVFICHCGGNISKAIDMEKLTEYASKIEGVVTAHHYIFVCSEAGQDLIRDKVAEYDLDRVVVASCSPKFHEPTFRRTLEGVGLNPYYLAMANIREHCSFPHANEPEKALEKAKDLLRGAVARAKKLEPIEKKKQIMNKDVLVIGAGIAGIQASLDLADAGFKVYLVEKEPSIGGNMPKVVKTFPTDDCAMCTIAPKMNEVAVHKNIEVLSYSEVRECNGTLGNFEVKVVRKPRYVDEKKCVGCGDCMSKCPSKTRDDYNQGLGERKAIYIPFPNALPKVATIDSSVCIYFTKGKCQNCKKVCPADAIDYEQKEESLTLYVGAIIVATGYEEFDPTIKKAYGYGQYPNVITQMQLARMIDPNGPTEGHIIRPSDGKEPKSITMIQCVGSRDEQVGNNYCSRVCCMIAIKHANLIKRDIIKDCEITICYMDLRAFGKGYEEYWQRVQELGITFLRGRPGEVDQIDGNNLIVKVENTLSQTLISKETELVVLSCATRPSAGTEEIIEVLGISKDENGFVKEFHPKLRPVDTSIEGIFVAGSAQGPKDIPDAVAQAKGAAAGVEALLSSDVAEISLDKALNSQDECKGCDICAKTCPFDAITMVDLPEGRKAVVSEVLCHGCGMCAANCPTGAMQLRHYKDSQVLAEVGALLERR